MTRDTAEMTTTLMGRALTAKNEPPTPLQLALLGSIVRESSRRATVQLPGGFAHRDDTDTPLAELVRHGAPALKLYLTLVLATRTPPHTVYRGTSAARFARTLGFDDSAEDAPASSGTRKIQRAIVALDRSDKKFIWRTPRPGRLDEIVVNHFTADLKPPYITLPLDLWRHGWINVMSNRALATYVALRHACAGDESNAFHVPKYKRDGYGISDETWAGGAADLKTLGLLAVTKGTPEDRDVPRRKRNMYKLDSSTMTERRQERSPRVRNRIGRLPY